MTLVSTGADRLEVNQGLLFGIDNLAWAAGQGVAAAAGGAIAQATTDLVPYGLLAAACAASLVILGPARRRLTAVLASRQRRPAGPPGRETCEPPGREVADRQHPAA